MAGLNLYVLGSTRVALADATVEVKPRKALALLIYLAVTTERHSRDSLATLLWPESSQSSARKSLRSRLSELNQALGEGWIEADREGVRLREGCWIDVAEFQKALAEKREIAQSLRKAADLYRDDFLTGFTLPDCPEFDEWQFFQAESLRQSFAAALEKLIQLLPAQEAYEEAISYGRRWLALDPLHEPAHRALMRLYAQAGQQAAALRQYDQYRQTLEDELSIPPTPETTALFERIRDRKIKPVMSVAVSSADRTLPSFLARLPSQSNALPLFVAREKELSQLAEYLERALYSRGNVAFIKGEAGHGKTSLLNAFARQAQIAHPNLIVSRGVCNVYTGVGDPYLPFREVLRMLSGDLEIPWAAGTIARDQAIDLWNFLPYVVQTLLDYGPNLIDAFVPKKALVSRANTFINEQADWLPGLQELSGGKMVLGGGSGPDQNHLFEEYAAVLIHLASRRPMLILLDDLHWVDLSSVSLLFHLSRQITTSRILIVGAYRPEDLAHDKNNNAHPLAEVLGEFKRLFGDVWIDLTSAAQTVDRHFIDALLDAEPNQLTESFREALARHTGGHPLFTSELLNDMKERGDLRQDGNGRWLEGQNLNWNTLPTRVEGVIGRRMDRLDTELRDILTVASVEGEEFTAEVVAQVQEINLRELVSQLSGELDRQHRLVKEQGLVQLNDRRLSRYLFRHNLFQKYLYNGLGEVERSFLHEAVGNALERLYEDEKQEIAVQMAYHFKEAGVTRKAVAYLLLAGQNAIRLSANKEAITHLREGLKLLKTLPASPHKSRQELMVLLALGVPVSATKGYAAPELEEIYKRARDLGQQLGRISQLFQALHNLSRYYGLLGQLQKSLELAEQNLQLAQTTQNTTLLLEAHRSIGGILFHLGELLSAQKHLEACMVVYDAEQHRSHAFLYGHDPAVTSLNYAALNLWLLGYPDQSLLRSHEIFQLVQETLSHPFSLAYTLVHAAWLHKFRQEIQVVQKRTEMAITLAADEGFPQWLAFGTILKGWALAAEKKGKEGIEQIRKGLDIWKSIGIKINHSPFLALLVEVYQFDGQIEAALTTLDEAQTLAQLTGETWWNAELYRLKGELLIQGKFETDNSVEMYFHEAIDIARRQKAKSLELRAVMSLCRLWQKQGNTGEALHMLAEIYNWFTEGFDTADLREARELLKVLSLLRD